MRLGKAFTLTELMVAIVILVAAVAGVMGTSVFFLMQVRAQMERADCQTQLNFAFEDIKLRFMSAADVDPASLLDVTRTEDTRTSFRVLAEKDVYAITPSETILTNAWYTYKVSDSGTTAGSIIRTGFGADEVLVDARFEPIIEFVYMNGDPPNFLTVRITAKTKTSPLGLSNEVVREEGIRFWFVDVAI